MQYRVSRRADYNCKHRLLVSAACTLSSVLSLQKFSHFNQCPPLGASLSLSPVISMSICSSSLLDGLKFRDTSARDSRRIHIPRNT